MQGGERIFIMFLLAYFSVFFKVDIGFSFLQQTKPASQRTKLMITEGLQGAEATVTRQDCRMTRGHP